MSIKLMAQIWERELHKAEQSILLAMADHADDNGSHCFPSVDLIAWKTDYSDRQVQRTIRLLCTRGVLVLVRPAGRGRGNEYKIDISKATPKQAYMRRKGDMASSFRGDTMSPLTIKGDIVSPANSDMVSPLDALKGDIDDIKGDISEPTYSYVRSESPIQPPELKEDDTHASDPVADAWFENYGEEIPDNIKDPLQTLVGKCGQDAVIHGIAAGAKSDSRNFLYIAKCARNYLPPAMNGNANGYAVELPGVYALTPSQQPTPPPPVLPPAPIDDPWAAALAELSPTLPGVAASYLTNSRMERGEDYEGLPLYRIVVEARAAPGLDWLNKQTSAVIRRTLGSILRQRIVVEIVAAEMETIP